MPGVAVIQNFPGLAPYAPSHSSGVRDGYGRAEDIKHEVQQFVKQTAKGASPGNMIKSARHLYATGKTHESQGDLQAAYSSYMKAVSLARMAMEYPKKDTALSREINEFFEHDGFDITERVSSVEEKLKSFEKSQSRYHSSLTNPTLAEAYNSPSPASPDGPVVKPMGSLADRIKSLGESGMDTSLAGKRMSRNLHQSAPSVSPKVSAPSLPTPPPSLTPITPSPSISSISSSSSISSTSSSHTIVSPSSLGPQSSPLSTPTSSPHLDATERFHKAFPPLEEVEENSLTELKLPSAPTAPPKSSPQPTGLNGIDVPSSPTAPSPPSFSNFTVPVDRPSSTPIPPVLNAFNSRPASPTKPSVPYKPSALSATAKPGGKPLMPVSTTATVQDLKAYLTLHHILLLDVRPRSEFDREHIPSKSKSAVCIEPYILQQEGITMANLESAMLNAPKAEHMLFNNRDKFELVVVYDEDSTSRSPSNSPISILLKLIEDKSESNPKILRREPMLLVGGMAAWRREARGEQPNGIVAPDPHRILPPTPMSPPALSSSPSRNPFLTNGMVNGTSGHTSPFVSTPPVLPPQPQDPHQIWTPPAGTSPPDTMHALDQYPSHSRVPAETSYPSPPINGAPVLTRRPAMSRPGSISYPQTRPNEPVVSPGPSTPSFPPGAIQYPQIARRAASSQPGIGSSLPLHQQFDIASPPQASINPSQLSRKRSDYIDQAQEALANVHTRPSIDYPELAAPQVLRPPPAAASSALERQDNRPRLQQIAPAFPQASPNGTQAPVPPKIPSNFPAMYWSDTQIGTSGLKNMGNTCYMNAPIQCLSATAPFARFFTEGKWKPAINYTNHLGSKGVLTASFAKLLHEMWGGELPYLSPMDFRRTICSLKSQYNGSDQHDSQEFLSFLLDGIHEDLNRVICKPPPRNITPEYEAELERLPAQEASDREWEAWRSRNDSLIVDYFQGQFRSRLQCLTCNTTSTTYNVFSILQIPIPQGKSGKVPLSTCLDTFFNEEILERDDAWDCPRCKTKRRASKRLSLARLPPILLIHLKRFEAHGHFSDKIDTFVDFPMKSLDLTGYMPVTPMTQSTGPSSFEDPHVQRPPYRYDLYGVTNHYGNLSSGHYTAFIASQGKWLYCDDSSIKQADSKQVVSQKAYVLFYKRVQSLTYILQTSIDLFHHSFIQAGGISALVSYCYHLYV